MGKGNWNMQKRGLAEKSSLDWASVAVGSALLMLLYFTVSNHVDLYPLNNLAEAGPLWPSTLAGWTQFVIFIGLVLTRRPLLTFAALVISIVWLSLQFRQWYIPYLFGKGNTDWFIEHGYDATMKILPAISGRVVTPDLQHNILQLLSAVVIFTAVKAFLQSRRNYALRQSESMAMIRK